MADQQTAHSRDAETHKDNTESRTERPSDAAGVPTVDLSPMTFECVTYRGRSLILDPPLTLTPVLDESGQLHVATDEQLGVHVFAPTREQLADELVEQLLFLWDTYAQEAPERLTKAAQQLRNELRKRLKEAA